MFVGLSRSTTANFDRQAEALCDRGAGTVIVQGIRSRKVYLVATE